MEIHVPGMVAEGTYRFALAEDGMSITWQRAINRVCLNKERLRGVMGENLLRVMRAVEAVAASKAGERPSMARLEPASAQN